MSSLLSLAVKFSNTELQIVVTGVDDAQIDKFVRAASKKYVPNLLVVRLSATDKLSSPFLCNQNSVFQELSEKAKSSGTRAVAYVCENFTCGLPIEDMDDLRAKV